MKIFPIAENRGMTYRKFYIRTPFSGLGLGLLLLFGCASNPSTPVEQAAPSEKRAAPNGKQGEQVYPSDSIWIALENKDSEKARTFIVGSTDINATDEQGRTPLYRAVENKDAELAAFFIDRGALVDKADRQGQTPLGVAAANNDVASAAVLARAGANIHHAMPDGKSPARLAVDRDGAFLEALITEDSITTTDQNGNNILDLALANPNLKVHAESARSLILADAVPTNMANTIIYTYFAPAVLNANYNYRINDGITPLHAASREGHIGFMEFLIEQGADVNIKNASGSTPLHEAVRSGKIDAIKVLLASQSDINAQDARGNSVLHLAIRDVPLDTHREIVNLLLAQPRINPSLWDEYGDSPLHATITLKKDPEIIKALLKKGSDVNVRNIEGKTPLYVAIEQNRPQYITVLLEGNSNLFAADNSGVTPYERALNERADLLPYLITPVTVLQSDGDGNTILHMSVRKGCLDTVQMALDKGARIDARNKVGDTALHIAVRQNNEVIGKLLITRKASIFALNAASESVLYLAFHATGGVEEWILTPETIVARDGLGNTVLHYAAQWKMNNIPQIVQRGADVEAANATGETPIFAAVKADSPATITVLLSVGARVDARDKMGNSALHASVRYNKKNSALSLIAAGIDINAHALNGKTPLHDAVRLGISDVETVLTSKHADLEARDTDGNTPFMETVKAGQYASAERLAKLGADTNTRNNAGETPLHIAVALGKLDLTTLILGRGASIHARNSKDMTPFRIGLSGSTEMVTLLIKNRVTVVDDYGASPLNIAIQDRAPLDIVKTILSAGARLSSIDSRGRTPLRIAVDNRDWNVAQYLTEAGSDVFSIAGDRKTPAEQAIAIGDVAVKALFSGKAISAQDNSGNTVLHYAAQSGNPAMVTLLIDLGADKMAKNIAAERPVDVAQRWKKNDAALLLN
ncbi:MAG: ankyrin repeat domain-containing protein [Treponema sp.]|jgi:ankyrin repeat protein|nr:ankyrin repeat domain-containing protein [Treponema sp.]